VRRAFDIDVLAGPYRAVEIKTGARELAPWEIGEIHPGPQVMQDGERRRTQTAAALPRGWYYAVTFVVRKPGHNLRARPRA
jgi:hypothetical protein